MLAEIPQAVQYLQLHQKRSENSHSVAHVVDIL